VVANQKLARLNREFSERLDQFESEWMSGMVPDIAAWFSDSGSSDRRDLSDLIELDLEYRWKHFSHSANHSADDEHGFPLYPRLEDYASLLPEHRRKELLVPLLIAEEYRVRTRWGDRPQKQSYLERFSDDRAELEAALAAIDKDFEFEEIDLRSEDSSQSMLDRSTLIVSKGQDNVTAETTNDAVRSVALGKYQLETFIGRGAFGEVWKAYDPALKRYVAIKFPRRDRHFSPEVLRLFESEAQKLASLGRIPGIVTVFDCGESEGLPYIVSDFIEGESLESRMKGKTLSHEESANIVAEIAAALHRAHIKGLVHRDIKPSNILLDAEERPVLADFGLAIQEEDQLQEGRSVVGTFAFMSPEQARGESQRVDGRADIYALGVVLYRLLTGRLPYLGHTPDEYIDQLLHQEPRPLRSIDDGIPVELERVCLKCLSKSIAERYTTAGDLAEELRRILSKTISTDHRAKLVLTVAFLFVGLVIVERGYFYLSQQNSSSENPSITSPHRDLERAQLAQLNEFSVRPEEVFNSGSVRNSDFHVDEVSNSLRLFSQNLSLVKLGRLDENDRTLSLTIRSPVENREAGIFVGFRNRKVDNRQQFQLIRLVNLPGDKFYSLRTIKVISRDNGELSEIYEYDHVPVELILQENTIEIHLASGRLKQIFWNGQLVEDVVTTQIDYPDIMDVTGVFGVFTDNTSSIFSEIRKNNQLIYLAN
jgi:eukaryotic-like serine/threonine-protein kinase